jgi:uncharacterized membrane protein
MHTTDTITIRAPHEHVFALARDVERWPELLAHYRWVRVLSRGPQAQVVEMAAWRPFGPVRYPTWWVSEMAVDGGASEIRYRHIAGITRGMEVTWYVAPPSHDGDVHVSIVHTWHGPRWPLGSVAAAWVIGPVFVHSIAGRTLAGIRRHAEAGV